MYPYTHTHPHTHSHTYTRTHTYIPASPSHATPAWTLRPSPTGSRRDMSSSSHLERACRHPRPSHQLRRRNECSVPCPWPRASASDAVSPPQHSTSPSRPSPLPCAQRSGSPGGIHGTTPRSLQAPAPGPPCGMKPSHMPTSSQTLNPASYGPALASSRPFASSRLAPWQEPSMTHTPHVSAPLLPRQVPGLASRPRQRRTHGRASPARPQAANAPAT